MHSIQLKRTLELIWVKASLNLRSEASVNYLSYAWWVIEPLLHMVVYYVVFSFLLARGGENYVAFLLTGLIPWLWFSKTISHTMSSILHGKELMNQLYIPKLFFPLTFVVQDSVKQIIVFILLLSFLFLYGISPSLVWLHSIPIIFVQFLLIIGCSLIAALLVPFVRDMSFIIPTGLQFMMFCSGIFFSHHDIPEIAINYFFLNPMAVILVAFRDVLVDGVTPNYERLGFVAIFSMALIALATLAYKKLEYILPRVVLE
ncbi:ABC transporter permease [Vibrio sp. dsl-7]|uniref:Transport permease protein n=1 Tax=Vibrio chanodichtyis TaxID=3027932 RepID=A0ABT5V1U7_9VIBR|nr:ABC transporter permease [Vibrio chanodichtyis]MDE1515554.1 ABC transporter permease [Vibrio chanodichtyis]